MVFACTSTVSMNVMRPAEINIPSKKNCAIGYISVQNPLYVQLISDSLTHKIEDSNYFNNIYSYKQCENIIQSKSKYYTKVLSRDRLLDEICSYFKEATVIKIRVNENFTEDPPPQKIKQKPYRSEIEQEPNFGIQGHKNGNSGNVTDDTSKITGHKNDGTESTTHVKGHKNDDSEYASTQSNTSEDAAKTPAYHYGKQTVTMYISIIDAQSQSIITEKTYSDTQEDSCLYEDYYPQVHDRYKMASKSFDILLSKFVNDLTPHRELLSVSFISDKNFINLDNVSYLFNKGFYDEGMDILKEYAFTDYGNDVINAKASYNYGIVLALTGDYDKSAKYLLKAYKLQDRNSKYKQGLDFLKREKENAEKVNSQLTK